MVLSAVCSFQYQKESQLICLAVLLSYLSLGKGANETCPNTNFQHLIVGAGLVSFYCR